MSPERTSHATSLPVRADRSPRADQPAQSDTFATLLGAHADRPERAPSRRERQPADDNDSPRQRDNGPVDRPDRRRTGRTSSDAAHAPAKPAGGRANDAKDAAKPADDAAAKAALLALGVPAPQPIAAQATPAAVAAQATPAAAAQQAPTAARQALAATQATPDAQPPQGAAPAAAAPATAAPVPATTAPAVPVPAEAAAQAIAADTPATTDPAAPSAADAKPADAAAKLSDLPAVPGPRAEARTQPDAPTVSTATAAATPAQTGDASARQGESGQARHDQPQAAAPVTQTATPAPTARTDFSPLTAASAPGLESAPKGTATLSQAPRAVGQLIHLAQEKGVQHARLNLRPVELGGIEIRLQSTSGGVTAQVVADSPQAARLLQQASDDLKRSLASQNVQLLSLDVSTSGDDRRDASAASSGFGQFDEAGTRGQAGFGRSQRAAVGQADSDLPSPTQGTVLELPDGVLVDVLA
jgi:flagellar hook-length control protein FliK